MDIEGRSISSEELTEVIRRLCDRVLGLNNACHNADENEGTDVQGSVTSLSEPIKAQLCWFAVGGFCGMGTQEEDRSFGICAHCNNRYFYRLLIRLGRSETSKEGTHPGGTTIHVALAMMTFAIVMMITAYFVEKKLLRQDI